MNKASRLGEYWDRVYANADPWHQHDTYETTKRSDTLELLPEGPINRALEIGCGEGQLAVHLARRVENLTCVDVSAVALNRARAALAGVEHVAFGLSDVFQRLPHGQFDLVVCSEVLCYATNRIALWSAVRRLSRHLRLGGHLLLAHASSVTDDRRCTGFDFHEIGSAFIGQAVAQSARFELQRQLMTGCYGIQLFRRVSARTPGFVPSLERREVLPAQGDRAFGLVRRGGCDITASEARHRWVSSAPPILMYHRVADEGPQALQPYRVSVQEFRRQMSFLARNGFRTIDLKEAVEHVKAGRPIPGRPVVLTFDDGYRDFHDVAWPILREHDFTATVFVPTGFVGAAAEWDAEYGEPAPLMSWSELDTVAGHGVTIESHGHSHRRLDSIGPDDRDHDLTHARELIAARLGRTADVLSYPFSAVTDEIAAAAARAGYQYAVAGHGLPTRATDSLRIPRQEVLGHYTIGEFSTLLGSPRKAQLLPRLRYRWRRLLRDRRTYTDF